MPIFNNTASLSYNGNTVLSNTVTGNLLEVLSMTKTALTENYSSGDVVTYVVSLINTGGTVFNGVSLVDNLGLYTQDGITRYPLSYVESTVQYYQNGVLQPTPSVEGTQGLTVNGISVPAGGNAIVIYQARANEFAPLGVGGSITNTVTASGGNVTTPITATETITVEESAELSITKSLTPTTVTENSRLTYTFVIQNRGNTPATADDNVVLSDMFTPVLSSIVVEYNGEAVSTENYTYSETTGQFATVPGFITVPGATYLQDPVTGVWSIVPGEVVVTVTGTV